MGRAGVGTLFGLLLVLAAGCKSAGWYDWQWPWQKRITAGHEYNIPPYEDARFAQPPQFPKNTVTPGLKRDNNQLAGPNGAMPPGVGPMGPRGGLMQ